MAAPFFEMHRVSILALLLAASAVLSGCVYVRLARVKHQLAEVEKNVALDIRDGLWLSFAEPILLPEDILHVARREPSRVENGGASFKWIYRFSKRVRGGAPPGGRFDVPVELFFAGGKLIGGRLPERFGRILDVRFVQETLRAVGRARVEIEPRTVCGRVPSDRVDSGTAVLPTEQAVTDLFGRPRRRIEGRASSKLVYRYALDPGRGSLRPRRPRVELSFTFDHPGGRLLRVQARFAGITLDLAYPLAAPSGPSS